MNSYNAAAQYRQLGSCGAHPVGMVVRLYDALLDDFRKATEAVRAKQIENRTAALNHALLILAELEGTLDHQRGGQVAKHLAGLYRIARALIMEANLHNSVERTERLSSLFLPVRQAWRQAERELAEPSLAATQAVDATTHEDDGALAGARSWSV